MSLVVDTRDVEADKVEAYSTNVYCCDVEWFLQIPVDLRLSTSYMLNQTSDHHNT